MLTENTMERLRILTESAKYDVSCSSSGTVRSGKKGMVGNTVGGVGICHSFADDDGSRYNDRPDSSSVTLPKAGIRSTPK